MVVSATLNSRLASASAAACCALSKAASTSVLPDVKAIPLARNPTTGTIASAIIRVRTEILEISSLGEMRPANGNGITRIPIGNGTRPRARPTGRSATPVLQGYKTAKWLIIQQTNCKRMRAGRRERRWRRMMLPKADRRGAGLKLTLQAREATLAVEALLRDATAAVRGRVSLVVHTVDRLLTREQRAAHGLAWLATYVEAIRQLTAYAERMHDAGALGELEELLIRVGLGEYLAQI